MNNKRFPVTVPESPMEFRAFMQDIYCGIYCEYSDNEVIHVLRDRAMNMLLTQLGYDMPVPRQSLWYA